MNAQANEKVLLKSENGIVTLKLGLLNFEEATYAINDKFSGSPIYRDMEINNILTDTLSEEEVLNIEKLIQEKYGIKYVKKENVTKNKENAVSPLAKIALKRTEDETLRMKEKKISPLEHLSLKKEEDTSGNEQNDIKTVVLESKIKNISKDKKNSLPKRENLAFLQNILKKEEKETQKTHMVKNTMRSGTRVDFDGDVVVIGDVNAGAEVIASGDIIIMGTLKGYAHAGSKGDENARIIALSIKAIQIRIANKIAVPLKEQEPTRFQISTAKIQNENIIIEEKNK